MRTIDELDYQHAFVDALPGDPDTLVRPRQVHHACYSRVTPTPVSAPETLIVVPEVATLLDLDPTVTPALTAVLAGNRLAPGMQPYAACYGGHQFGNWAGQLGDGRAITLGEVQNNGGAVWEMQLKGAGPTPYSRNADGRAVLRSSVRELVCSEAMFHLGVPTTRALSLVRTGDPIVRDMLYDGNPEQEPGAIVCRVAPSFVRFGNFELFAARGDKDTLRTLTHYCIERFYPQHQGDLPGFFHEVCTRTAHMIAGWMRVGFVHGVMNTDNMSILGLTIDYGPYGWVEPFDPGWTPNTTDAGMRRYRFGSQPRIAQWNLAQLGNALLELHDDTAPFERALDAYADGFATLHLHQSLAKIGLTPGDADADRALITALFELLSGSSAPAGDDVEIDMTLFYRALARVPAWGASMSADARFALLQDAFYAPDLSAEALRALHSWLDTYLERVRAEAIEDNARKAKMDAINPMYVPRNWLVQQTIERVTLGEGDALNELLEVLREPYRERPGLERFAQKRPEWARHRPGCSMLSCSS